MEHNSRDVCANKAQHLDLRQLAPAYLEALESADICVTRYGLEILWRRLQEAIGDTAKATESSRFSTKRLRESKVEDCEAEA
jgi:hypothetical protein